MKEKETTLRTSHRPVHTEDRFRCARLRLHLPRQQARDELRAWDWTMLPGEPIPGPASQRRSEVPRRPN